MKARRRQPRTPRPQPPSRRDAHAASMAPAGERHVPAWAWPSSRPRSLCALRHAPDKSLLPAAGSTDSRAAPKLTVADPTPGSEPTAFSIVRAQSAQSIPSIVNSSELPFGCCVVSVGIVDVSCRLSVVGCRFYVLRFTSLSPYSLLVTYLSLTCSRQISRSVLIWASSREW